MYVLDSSAIIELIEHNPLAQEVASFLKDEPLVTTSVCMHEVLVGARTDKEKFVFENLFSQMQVLEHDAESARVGATLKQQLIKTGISLNPFDTLIAGVCKANDAELVTLDKDFAKIKGLKVTIIGKRNA